MLEFTKPEYLRGGNGYGWHMKGFDHEISDSYIGYIADSEEELLKLRNKLLQEDIVKINKEMFDEFLKGANNEADKE